MQVITIFNEKGGVGKTTVAGIVGAGLAMRGHKVLLIDADGQGDLTRNMKVQPQAGFFKFVKWGDSNSPDYVGTKSLIIRVPMSNCPENLYIVAGSNETWGIPGSTNLRDIVSNMAKRLTQLRGAFDYAVIDTQPSATTLHEAIGLVTDWFLLPTDAEPLSAFGGLPATIGHIEHMREQLLQRGHDKARVLGIVPNKFRMTTDLHKYVLNTLTDGLRVNGAEVHRGYGDLVWEPVPLRTNIPESQLVQTTLMHDAPHLETNDYLWKLVKRVEKETHGEKEVR